jgi:hypothetical protein
LDLTKRRVLPLDGNNGSEFSPRFSRGWFS